MPFASDVTRRGVSGGDYEIDNSLRFNDDDSAYLTWTPSSAGNQKTWTFSAWVKRGNISANSESPYNYQYIFAAAGNNYFALSGDDLDQLRLFSHDGSARLALVTEQVFRDHSAWYHLVFKLDTTQSTDTNRFKLYVNGVEVTEFKSTANNYSKTYPPQNYDLEFNIANAHYVGGPGANYFDGHMAEIHFVDGQALTPSEFGEFDSDYGHWKAKKYTGTHGTNGFHLDFKNSGSLGLDVSGNSNNWTPNNLSASDQMLDSPTNNFCIINPLASNGTFSEGDLKVVASGTTNKDGTYGTHLLPMSGKYYWECYVSAVGDFGLGLMSSKRASDQTTAYNARTFYYRAGNIYQGAPDGTTANWVNTTGFTTGDLLGVGYDADNNQIRWYKNGTLIYTMPLHTSWRTDGPVVPYFVQASSSGSSTFVTNFGQDATFAGNKSPSTVYNDGKYGSFFYQPPTGFKALCTQNLTAPTAVPGEHFNVMTYSGDGATNRAITGVGFQPDFTWFKQRNVTMDHLSFDSVRGAGYRLKNNTTDSEAYHTTTLKSFDSDGFTIGNSGAMNNNPGTYVAWLWKAGGAAVSNTNGSITSSVSANTAAGFSIVSYTGTGSANSTTTVGHGLSSAPDIVFYKERGGTGAWEVEISNITGTTSDLLYLNATTALDSSTTDFPVKPTSSLLYIGGGNVNEINMTMIAYCFHSVDGYSKIGSYTGNGNADGPFIYTGFQPKYVLMKKTSAAESWFIADDARESYNPFDYGLLADSSGAELTSVKSIDLLSNGFKPRISTGYHNDSGATYIYMAFAEFPFKFANAR